MGNLVQINTYAGQLLNLLLWEDHGRVVVNLVKTRIPESLLSETGSITNDYIAKPGTMAVSTGVQTAKRVYLKSSHI